MNTTVYRGETEGQNDGDDSGAWYTTDRDHAASFGDVAEYTLDVDDDHILTLTPDNAPDLYEASLFAHEEYEAIEAIVDDREYEEGAFYTVVILTDWEGEGDTVLDLAGEIDG